MSQPITKAPFIIIESLDAAGGSTQTDLLSRRLEEHNYIPHQYHFPQEHEATGQLIYQKFLRNKTKNTFTRREQALLYMQDFFTKLEEMTAIQNQQQDKNVIISDRYCTSTMAYQTVGLSTDSRAKLLKWIKWLAWEGEPQLIKPSATILLDIPVAVALERLKGKKKDNLEKEDMMKKVRHSYLRLAKDQGGETVESMAPKINTQRTKEDIHEEIWGIVSKYLS